MLRDEEKQRMIEQRLKEYDTRIFVHQMNLTACEANDDQEGAEKCKQQIEALRKARDAVEKMK